MPSSKRGPKPRNPAAEERKAKEFQAELDAISSGSEDEGVPTRLGDSDSKNDAKYHDSLASGLELEAADKSKKRARYKANKKRRKAAAAADAEAEAKLVQGMAKGAALTDFVKGKVPAELAGGKRPDREDQKVQEAWAPEPESENSFW